MRDLARVGEGEVEGETSVIGANEADWDCIVGTIILDMKKNESI